MGRVIPPLPTPIAFHRIMAAMMGHGGPWRMMRPRELEEQPQLTKELVRRIYGFAKPYRARLFGLLLLIIATSYLGVYVPPRLTQRIIDDAIRVGDKDLLTSLAILFLVVIAGQALIQVASRWLSARVGEGLIFDLRVALFNHVQRMPIAFFTRTQTGALISRLNSDVVGAQRAVTDTTVGVIQILLDVAFALVLMFQLESRLALMAVVLIPIFLGPTRRMGKILQRLIKQQMDNNAGMATQMTERFQVGGALLVKLFGDPRKESGRFSDKAGNVRDLGVKVALYGRLFFVAFSLIASVATVLAYWFGGRMVIDGVITIGVLVAFAQALTRLYGPITMLSNVRVEVMTALVSFERVFEVLDFPVSIDEKPSAVDLARPRGEIEFRNVRFRYPSASEVSIPSLELKGTEKRDRQNAMVLQDVSFHVPAGQMVALVGPSGAGKTTISMLVPRLYDVSSGQVLVDGVDVRDLTLSSLSAAVGTVTQDPHMFHETIRENLLYARPDATEQEIIEAAKAAQIHDLIASLPDGYDTMVGERGYRMSGGEKQRLAIARLLLKDPAIMILDEATAHLDSESEVAIQRALKEAFSGRTSLVIAHRLSTIVNADQILVIEGGRVAESGKHQDLLESGGTYAMLYRTQFSRSGHMSVAAEPTLEP